MGEIADDINKGLMCEVCGVWMPEVTKWLDDDSVQDPFENPPGYPQKCEDCKVALC